MALLKAFEQGTKKGNYWKVVGIYPDTDHGVSKVNVVLYESVQTRNASDSAIVFTKSYSLPGIALKKADVYEYLKKQADFTDAKDV